MEKRPTMSTAVELNTEVSFYDYYADVDSKKIIGLKDAFSKIKTNSIFKDIVTKMRSCSDEKTRNKLKAKLPLVTFSGKFKKRNMNDLEKASGIAVIDLDSFGNLDEIKKIKQEIIELSYVCFCFLSPSGGLKVGCRIPIVKSDIEYKQYYIPLSKEFDKYSKILTKKNDSVTKDISRLCCLSYDSDIYINENVTEYLIKDISVVPTNTKNVNEDIRFDRSEIEFNEVKILLNKKWTKVKIFEYMENNFEKWKTRPIQYRDLTYNKAYQSCLDSRKIKPIEFDKEKLTDIEKIKKIVVRLLLNKETKEASEVLAITFMQKYKTYSIKNDDKKEIYVYNKGIFVENGMCTIREYIRKILNHNYSTQFCNQVIEKVEVDSFISQEEFFNSEIRDEICVQNGILNVVTRKLSPFTPTKIFFNKLPVSYDFTKDCKIVKAFVKEIVTSEEDYKIIQELFGYTLYKDYSIEKSIMLTGKGRNGKGQLLMLLRKFVGAENIAALTIDQLAGQFDTVYLHKKLVNIAGDINGGYIKETGKLKTLTGKDVVMADRKFKTKVVFINYAKLVFSANELPSFADKSDGFWDRWILIDFPYRFEFEDEHDNIKWKEYKDKGLLKKRTNDVLNDVCENTSEMSGVLNWALDGLDELLKRGKYTKNPAYDDIQLIWDRKANSFKAFCDEELESTDDIGVYVERGELKKRYKKYCEKHSIKKPQPVSRIRAYLINDLACEESQPRIHTGECTNDCWSSSETTQIRVWLGIKWKKEMVNHESNTNKI